MLSCPSVEKRVIRGHYDLSTPFYRLLWGPHIHHGLWEADESPRQAQLQLTERLATLAGVAAGQELLDIGCGMGASSIYLAKTRGCRCQGVTISPLQRRWASLAAKWHRVARQVGFRCADAERIELCANSYDVVWSVECTEHLFEKAQFFDRAARWLKPSGTMAICAWLAGDTSDADRTRQVHDVCEGFFCPSLGTADDYTQWMEQAGMRVEHRLDWTARVARTWEICRDRVRRSRVRWLAHVVGHDSVLFLDRFDTILAAYRSGAMAYGCFIARKSSDS
jgi:cyclopropane fatty-acyl-phospholipid synthase-like methyltransferase